MNETRKARDGKLQYRLPTKKHEGQPYMLYNLRRAEDKTVTAHITSPTGSYLPNEIGVYNMIGNVAEMVAEEGIAKGGSWYHTYEDSKLSLDLNYTEASEWLGFRCICEMISEE